MDVDRGANTKEIGKKAKNCFNWKWLEKKDCSGFYLSDYIRKLDVCSNVRCTVCNITINYGSSGAKALQKHGNSQSHIKAKKAIDKNETLPAVFQFLKADHSWEASKPSSGLSFDGTVKINIKTCELPYGAAAKVRNS